MDLKQLRFACQTGNLKQIREQLQELQPEWKAEALKGVLSSPLRTEVLEYLGTEITRLPAELGSMLLIDLLYSEEVAARNLAIELFSAFGQDGINALQHHLNDLDADVRLFSIQALIQIPIKHQVLSLLRKQLEVEKEINILSLIIEALGDLGTGMEDADAIRAFMSRSDHPFLKFVTQRALLRLGVEP